MSGYGATRGHKGFTLIEMLIVITVIAILALIVIPRVQGAVIKAREATLKANLHQLRNAIGQFEADTGVYPVELDDVVEPTNATTAVGSTTVPENSYKGPYLTRSGGIGGTGLPLNPFGPAGGSATVGTHWDYTAADGTVRSEVDGTTLDNTSYSDL